MSPLQEFTMRAFKTLKDLTAHVRRPRPAERNRRPVQFLVEQLEDRTVPSVVYLPQYGAQGFVDKGGLKLNDVPVYLIFWGPSWQMIPSVGNRANPSAAEIASDVAGILSGPYLKGLTQ